MGVHMIDSSDAGVDTSTDGTNALVSVVQEECNALMLEHALPLDQLLEQCARAAEPNWHRTTARKAKELPQPTAWERELLDAASNGDVPALQNLLQWRRPEEIASVRLPPSSASALHLAAS